jgi:predicted metal-dependent HD superfamily phosphohydrolase
MFDQYERQIRLEYEWVTDKAFVSGRSAVLQSFLDRPAIYSTDFFRTKFEVQARHNITRSLACLSRRT